jgi:hypothetical protein
MVDLCSDPANAAANFRTKSGKKRPCELFWGMFA